jgi:FkbM family methyltransferase
MHGMAAEASGLARAGPKLKRLVRDALPHPIYRAYRHRRVARQIADYNQRVVTHRLGRQELKILLADPLGEGWYDHDSGRLPELAELARLGALHVGATVFDLGAHQAVVALQIADEIGESGRVIALEAEPHNADVARRNVELNNAGNIIVVHAAIADSAGRLNFATGLNGHADPGTRFGNVEVDAITVDQLADRYGSPDVVFIDVEGYEGKALVGAKATLAARRTHFHVEVHTDVLVDCTVGDLAERFDGYSLTAGKPAVDGSVAAWVPFAGSPLGDRWYLIASP